MSAKPAVRSVAELKVIKHFPIVKRLVANETDTAGLLTADDGVDDRKKISLRLLCVFGFNGTEVLYQTSDDMVYGYGHNRFGCLGLGRDGRVDRPAVNRALSGQRVVDVYNGFGHCLALTSDGQCYGWGENDFGQCGVGCFANTNTPTLIRALIGRQVVRMSVGNRHSMALTAAGRVYAWGRNTFGQLGDGTVCWRGSPVRVLLDVRVASVSCGKCHSLALSADGVAYVWGLNDFGQLGRHRERDLHERKERAFAVRPSLVSGFADKRVAKAVCGPNHTFLLTSDGQIYAFGLNETGQIGNHSFSDQSTPVRIGADRNLLFNDIVCNYDNNLSIAVSLTGRVYCWGFKKLCAPAKMSETVTNYTIFDVYAKYSGVNKTYESVIFGQSSAANECHNRCRETSTVKTNDSIDSNDINDRSTAQTHDYSSADSGFYTSDEGSDGTGVSPRTTPASQVKPINRNVYNNDIVSDMSPIDPTARYRDQCPPVSLNTNSQITGQRVSDTVVANTSIHTTAYDLKFGFEDNCILCHKQALKNRNAKFWQNCETFLSQNTQQSDDNMSVIYIKTYTFEAFHAFISFLYGINPHIDCHTFGQLWKLSTIFDEPSLALQCVRRLPFIVSPDTICTLYESAIAYQIKDLEKHCVEFVVNNSLVMTACPKFQSMTDQMYRRLLDSAISI